MKGKGTGLLVAVIVALVGGLAFWKLRGSDNNATSTMTQGNGSAVSTPAAKPSVARTAKLAIAVKDDAGPVADAFVRIAPADGEVIAMQTDTNGVARADALAPGTYEISASATGHEPAALTHELAAGDDAKLVLELARGGRVLSGVVTDVSGGPIAGARIDAAKLGAMARPDRAIATVLTGADGKYQLAVAEGQLLVAARSPDYAAQSRIVDVGPSGATADFALVPGGVIEGVVLDEQTRAPVPNAIVDASRDGAAVLLAETRGVLVAAGPDGKFRLTGLRPGAYELAARGEGKRSKSPTVVGLGIAEQVADVEILVGRSPVVRGVVVDESGAPVAHARVIAMARGGGEGSKCDDKGAFVIEGLVPGDYMLIATSSEHFGDPAPVSIADKDVDGVVVRVRRGAKIVGRVEPPQVCEVKAEAKDRAPRGAMRILALTAPTTTDADGKFEIGPLVEGEQRLAARCASGDQGSASVDVKPGINDAVVTVAPGAAIAGRVLDGDGTPVAGVSVMATAQEGGDHTLIVNGVITSGVQALTNGTGGYELRGLAAGTYRMSVLDRGQPMRMKGKPPKPVLAAAEKKTGVDLAVERPNGVIKGVVLGPDGKPLADAWVSVSQDLEALLENMDRGDDGPRGRMLRVESRDDGTGAGASAFPPALTDAQGRFEIRHLPKSKYDVTAEAQAGKLRGRIERVEPDAEVTVRALGVTSLSGTVTGARGPVARFEVELDGPTRAQRSFADGKFELARVDPGDYVVKVTSTDGNGEAKVTVLPGQPAHVDIALVANAIVVGTLVDAQGKPVEGVPVTVIDDDGSGTLRVAISGPPPTSGPDGKFRVEHKAGKAALMVLVRPSPISKRGLVLEAGKALDVGQVRVDAAAPPP